MQNRCPGSQTEVTPDILDGFFEIPNHRTCPICKSEIVVKANKLMPSEFRSLGWFYTTHSWNPTLVHSPWIADTLEVDEDGQTI